MKNNLSTKDLSYVCDMFNWNLNIYKTCNLLLNHVNDEDLQKVMEKMIKNHKNNCKDIKGGLN